MRFKIKSLNGLNSIGKLIPSATSIKKPDEEESALANEATDVEPGITTGKLREAYQTVHMEQADCCTNHAF